MTAIDDFILNLQQNRVSANPEPMRGDIDVFIAALQALSASPTGTILATVFYTPTLVNGVNVAASVAFPAFAFRVGDIVVVFGSFTLDPIAGAADTRLTISLPIPSNLATATTDAAGVAIRSSGTIVALSGSLGAEPATDTIQLVYFNDADVASRFWLYIFGYRILP